MATPFDEKEITVTKLDAARAQFATAVDLWFNDRDPISALALSYAAYEVIHSVARRKGVKDLLYDTATIKDEHRKEFSEALHEAPNFFKHSKDGDPDSTLSFQPGTTSIFLLMGAYALALMKVSQSGAEMLVNHWFAIHHPTDLLLQKLTDNGLPGDRLKTLRALSKKQYFQAFAQILADERIKPFSPGAGK
jgi:hypothetical protein